MSQARTNARRRRQAANGYRHLPPNKRPNYRQAHNASVGEAIAMERHRAAAEARRSAGKKKKA